MEWYQLIKDLISNVGFPIACAIAMYRLMDKERAAHKEESEKWCGALDRNTDVIEKLIDTIKNSGNR